MKNPETCIIAQNALGHGTIYMYLYPTLSTHIYINLISWVTQLSTSDFLVLYRESGNIDDGGNTVLVWHLAVCSSFSTNFILHIKNLSFFKSNFFAESGQGVMYISRRVERKWNYWRWLKYCSCLTFGSLLAHLYLTSQTSLFISLLLRLILAESCHELNKICRRVGRKL